MSSVINAVHTVRELIWFFKNIILNTVQLLASLVFAGLSLSNHFLYAGIYRVSIQQLFLPMRRYASAGASYCPVSISVTSRCSIRRDEWINLVLAWGLLSTSPTLRKFRYLQK